MNIIAKPYFISPFKDLERMGCPWIEELRSRINDLIDRFKDLIRSEADYDGQPELADEDFLYKCFKENCASGQYFGNWQVLKYFIRFFKIKILFDMLGEWRFTERDREIYNYFSELKVNEKNKCKASMIKCKSGVEPDPFMELMKVGNGQFDYHITAKLYLRGNEYDNASFTFVQFFGMEFNMLNDIACNCKMLTKRYPRLSFFEVKKIHNPYDGIYNIDYEDLSDRHYVGKSYGGYIDKVDTTVASSHIDEYHITNEDYQAKVDITTKNYHANIEKTQIKKGIKYDKKCILLCLVILILAILHFL